MFDTIEEVHAFLDGVEFIGTAKFCAAFMSPDVWAGQMRWIELYPMSADNLPRAHELVKDWRTRHRMDRSSELARAEFDAMVQELNRMIEAKESW